MIGPGNKKYDVIIQSQTEDFFQYFLMREDKTDISLTAPIAVDQEIISVSAGHGFAAVAGEYIVIRNGDFFIQARVVSVNVNDITIDIPSAVAIPQTACVMRGNILMNVNGSVTPQYFKYSTNYCGGAQAVIPIDLSYAYITIQHPAAQDDGKFGGITALTKGIYFRKIDGSRTNLGNFRTNKDFRDFGADVEYTDKAPAGTYSTNIEFDFIKKFTKEIRLDPRENDMIIGKVRDKIDVGAGITLMTTSIIGSYTTGE